MNERFQFLRTYADSLNELAKADENLAKELAWKIIQYGVYDENIISENPIIEAMFIQIKLMIDNWKAITDKNRENWKKWWRPKNPNKTQTKPNDNPNESETKPKETKIENRKDKIENNILTLSKDKEEDKSSYGNEEINKCLELIKNYNNGLIDGTKQNQRRFAKHLINKLNQLDSIKDWKYTWQDTLEIILKIISQNKYYSSKITSPEAIYRNLAVLMQQCKNDVAKQNTDNVILETL